MHAREVLVHAQGLAAGQEHIDHAANEHKAQKQGHHELHHRETTLAASRRGTADRVGTHGIHTRELKTTDCADRPPARLSSHKIVTVQL